MKSVNIHDAKTNFSRLLRRVAAGEEIVISRAGTPIARLVPVANPGKRNLGTDVGAFIVPDDFNDPLPDGIIDAFES